MNIPAMIQPTGVFANVTAPGGQMPAANAASGDAATGVGELFSLQMGLAMQNLQADEQQPLIGQGLSEEELKAMEALMALLQQLQQLLANQPEDSQQLEAFLAENKASIQQLASQLEASLPQLSSEWKQLLARLKNLDETPAEGMQKLYAMIREFLPDKEKGQDKPAMLLSRQNGLPVAAGIRESAVTIQPLRAQQGLNAYKQEAAIQVQPVSAQTTAQLSSQLASAEANNPQVLQNLLNATAGTVQTAQPVRLELLQTQTQGALMQEQQAEGTFQQPLANALSASAGSAQPAQSLEVPVEARSYTVPTGQLPEQVTRIFVKQMNLSQVNGLHQAKLILHPESLGQVQVTITSKNGVITAHFAAETKAGKELLDNQLFHLRAALVQNGLQVDRLEVTQQQPSSQNLNPQEQREQGKQQQEQQPKQQDKRDEHPEFVLESLLDDEESAASLWDRLRESSRRVHDLV